MLGKGSKTTITMREIPLFTDKYYDAGKRRKSPKNFNIGPWLVVIMVLIAAAIIVVKSW